MLGLKCTEWACEDQEVRRALCQWFWDAQLWPEARTLEVIAQISPHWSSQRASDPEQQTEEILEIGSLDVLREILERGEEWTVDGLLAPNVVTILSGQPGLGKSMLAMSIAFHRAHDAARVFGRISAPKKGVVVYIDGENTIRERAKRAWAFHRHFSPEAAPEFQFIGYPTYGLSQGAMLARLKVLYDGKQIDSIYVDTLQRLLDVDDDNAAAEIDRAMAELEEIARVFECPVMVLAHPAKGSSVTLETAIQAGKTPTDIRDAVRGSSRVVDAATLVLVMVAGTEDGDETFLLHTVKNRIGEQTGDIFAGVISAVILPVEDKTSGRNISAGVLTSLVLKDFEGDGKERGQRRSETFSTPTEGKW